MARFRINHDKVIRQANEIDDLSVDLGREITSLEGLLAQIKRDWKGPASEAFQTQLSRLINDMKSTKRSISSVASTIETVANRIQKEDERLAESAKSL